MKDRPGLLLAALVVLVVVIRWIPGISGSLWLDEALTAWIIEGDLAQTLQRGTRLQVDTGYYLLLWGWTQVFGNGELALRLPSLLATLVAIGLLYRLGSELGDRELGLLAAGLFASCDVVLKQASNARSYPVATMLLVLVAVLLLRWLRERRMQDAVAVGCASALLVHVMFLFALAFPALALYAASARPRPVRAQAAVALAILAVGAALYAPAFAALLARSGDLVFTPPPTVSDLWWVWVWPNAVIGLLYGLVFFWLSPRDEGSFERDPVVSRTAAMLALWAFLPPLIVFAVSTLTPSRMFIDRFMMSAAPATALLYAHLVHGRVGPAARRAVVIAAVVAGIAAFAPDRDDPRRFEDFRGAAGIIREFGGGQKIPVLVASGFVESREAAWRDDPERARYLLSPFQYYDTGGRLLALPPLLNDAVSVSDAYGPVLRDADRFAVVEREGTLVLHAFARYAERRGLRARRESLRGLEIGLFERP